jgi:adenylosuccinate lyase
MIERYSLAKMKKVWTDENKFNSFLKVEIAATHAFSQIGVVPESDYIKIRDNAKIDINRILELEAITKHDVIAFTRTVSESLGDEKKWVHYGLTSTDVVDSANGLLFKEANDIIQDDLNKLLDTLKSKALTYQNTPIMGRTHGMHAEITSFGLKYALWYDELKRDMARFEEARKDVEACKLSGAVGNYITTSIEIEQMVADELGLQRARISTQVLSRDRHAYYIEVLALIASLLEKMATEIRNLSRQEVHEVEEGFSKGQKGSSAMPHKRNPIGSENICGCARVIKAYVNTALDNNILWHERDISHSSAERIIMADSTTLLDYMLNRFTKIIENLVVYEDKMIEDIYLTYGVIFSGSVLNKLVSLGWSREEAYDKIQPLTFKALNEKIQFRELLKETNWLNEEELKEIFNLQRYMKHVDEIYKSVGIKE